MRPPTPIPGGRRSRRLDDLLSSHDWRQDHDVLTRQHPGFIDHVVNNVTGRVMRVARLPTCTRDDLCETFFALNRVRGTLYDGTTRLHRTDGTPLAMYSMAGLAQYAVVPATAVFPVPDGLNLAAADSRAADPVERVRELTEGNGVDVAFEALGGPDTFQQALAMVREGGTMVAVGSRPRRHRCGRDHPPGAPLDLPGRVLRRTDLAPTCPP